MSKRLMQDKRQGEDEQRVVAKSRSGEKVWSLWHPIGLEFKFYTAQPGESKSKLFNEHGETRGGDFEREQRVKFSSVARRRRHEPEHGETRCETENVFHRQRFDSSQSFCVAIKYLPYVDKVFDNVRQKLGRPEDDHLEQIDVNLAMWRIGTSGAKSVDGVVWATASPCAR